VLWEVKHNTGCYSLHEIVYKTDHENNKSLENTMQSTAIMILACRHVCYHYWLECLFRAVRVKLPMMKRIWNPPKSLYSILRCVNFCRKTWKKWHWSPPSIFPPRQLYKSCVIWRLVQTDNHTYDLGRQRKITTLIQLVCSFLFIARILCFPYQKRPCWWNALSPAVILGKKVWSFRARSLYRNI